MTTAVPLSHHAPRRDRAAPSRARPARIAGLVALVLVTWSCGDDGQDRAGDPTTCAAVDEAQATITALDAVDLQDPQADPAALRADLADLGEDVRVIADAVGDVGDVEQIRFDLEALRQAIPVAGDGFTTQQSRELVRDAIDTLVVDTRYLVFDPPINCP